MTSPEGFPVIAAAVHTVDRLSDREGALASSQGHGGMRRRAACATSIIRQVVDLSEKRRREAAEGQRIGQVRQIWQPGPSIIVAGDFNITMEALLDAMTKPIYSPEAEADTTLVAWHSGSVFAITDRVVNRYERLPAIRGADGNKDVDCYDICLDKPYVLEGPRQPQGPPPGHTRVGDEADLERSTKKLEADLRRAAQEEADATEARSSGEGTATTLDAPPQKKPRLGDSPLPRRRATSPAAPPRKKPRLGDKSPLPRRRATSPAEKQEEPVSPAQTSPTQQSPRSPASASEHRHAHVRRRPPSRSRPPTPSARGRKRSRSRSRRRSPAPTPSRHRRAGLPWRAIVQRTAGLFVVTNVLWQRNTLRRTLYFRSKEALHHVSREAWAAGERGEEIILDMAACHHVKKTLRHEWFREPASEEIRQKAWDNALVMAQKRRRQGIRASARDCFARSMKSYWKTVVFHRYGGELWLDLLIATGRVHASVVEIVNEVITKEIRIGAERAPVRDPEQAQPSTRPRSEALASSQGQVRGVNHHRSRAKELRDKAKYADKLVEGHVAAWRQPYWKAYAWRCQADQNWWYHKHLWLRQHADQLWEEATKVSIEAGRPFQQRGGAMWQPERSPKKGMFEKVLSILKARIDQGDLKWPPAS